MHLRLLGLIGVGLFAAACTSDDGAPRSFNDDGATATTGASTDVTTTGGAGSGGGQGTVGETTSQSLARQQQQKGWGPNLCAGAPDGVETGLRDGQHASSDLTFKDCEGNDVSLADLCGADAVWLFFAHAWCPSCRATASRAEMLHGSFAGENVASVQIVVESGDGAPADAALCRRWRDEYGHADVLTLYDPNDHHAPLVEDGYTALNVVLDENHVITPKFHSSNQATIEMAIETAIER